LCTWLPGIAVFLLQYYYETIFPRIPKKVEDDIQAELRRRGLPVKGKGNGGCGGPDRRGGDEGNRRPASVKASLSVAFGQRAPNRAGTKTWKDERIKAVGGDGRGTSRDRGRDPSREPAAAADARRGGERTYGRSRSGSREGPRDRYSGYDSRDRDREREQEPDRNGRDHNSRRGDR
jgi:pre-mRNA-splicing factor 38B